MAEKELRSIQFPGLEDRYVVPEGGGGGATGPAGKDGLTPTIGANGNWYLGDTDTNKPSRGEKGDPGAKGADGAPGKDGSDGYSPEATVTQINGGAKIIIKDRNGTTSANVMNGAQGPKGDAGPQGDVGPKGDSYTLTSADKSEIAGEVVAGGAWRRACIPRHHWRNARTNRQDHGGGRAGQADRVGAGGYGEQSAVCYHR